MMSSSIDGCYEWVDSGIPGAGGKATKVLCGAVRDEHDTMDHDFVSRAEFEAAGAQGFEQTRAEAPALPAKVGVAYRALDALVRVDLDAVLNPSTITAMLEDSTTHRDGGTTKTITRTSIYLLSRQHPIVVEAPLDDVLARIVGARFEGEGRLPGDDAIVASLIGEETRL